MKSGALVVGDGVLELLEVQPEGKRTMTGAALVAGLAAMPDGSTRHDDCSFGCPRRARAHRERRVLESRAAAAAAARDSTAERAFATDLVYGTVRRRRALDFLLTPRSSQALARLEPVVRAALRMGAYQLVDGVPAHAAVGETVTAVATRAPAARGYVNGVLRAVARDGPPWSWPDGDDVESLGVRYSQPDWMVAMLLAQFGVETARAVLASADTAPAVTLRVNPKRATVDGVEAELVATGVKVERGALLSDALVATGLGDVGALAVVRDGRATPQDQASQAIARLVAAYAAERTAHARPRVLDVAAAPGGKATGIAELLVDGALVVAGDVNPSRAGRIRIASARLGLPGVVPIVADGQRPPVRPESFDAVLVDAPCTGLGVLRRRPDARWRVDPRRSRPSRHSNARCSPRRPTRCGPVVCSSTRCARSATRRRSESTPGPSACRPARSTHPVRRGGRTVGVRSSCRPTPIPTACSCWCSRRSDR